LSRAYLPTLAHLLDALESRLTADELTAVLLATGRGMAAGLEGAPAVSGQPEGARDRAAMALRCLGRLGGIGRVEERDGRTTIVGSCCPIRALVPAHPLACKLIEALVAAAVGGPVRESCDRGERPHCRLTISI
jgi:predicted ArsR family transcriptional regulator